MKEIIPKKLLINTKLQNFAENNEKDEVIEETENFKLVKKCLKRC